MSSNLSRNPSIKPVSNVNIDRKTMYQCVKKVDKKGISLDYWRYLYKYQRFRQSHYISYELCTVVALNLGVNQYLMLSNFHKTWEVYIQLV